MESERVVSEEETLYILNLDKVRQKRTFSLDGAYSFHFYPESSASLKTFITISPDDTNIKKNSFNGKEP